ncbi:zinc finger domain-containing protein [Purpureocillium lilacinum]|uniref:Zinc finger domain-containing protein n=1 Tax=Purpureocillium lilacinum TaxID=33203 RepID=A0A179H3D0_PURLI|nr:zinc finger domain-containing protein [Purpureocillium lilacinum]
MKRSREPEEEDDDEEQAQGPDPRVTQRKATTPLSMPGSPQRPPSKIPELDTAIDDTQDDSCTMRCSLPPHKSPISFSSYGDYETHYHQFHTNRCLECSKNFPSDHLLGVHIEEWHDPLVKVRRDKGEHTYSCFVEGCDRKCLTHQKRRMHMIDKHMYPKNFFFSVTKDGIDGRRSLLVDHGHHRRRSSASVQSKETRRRASTLEEPQAGPGPERSPAVGVEEGSTKNPKETQDADMADLTGALSALQFVPPSVRFGRGRAGFAKR